jgi:hypothetical protein
MGAAITETSVCEKTHIEVEQIIREALKGKA